MPIKQSVSSRRPRAKTFTSVLAPLLMSATMAPFAQAAIYNESSAGDFSNSGLAPTSLAFTLGSNTVTGVTGNAGSGVDRDYFTFSVGAVPLLASILVLPGTTTLGRTFIGIAAGAQTAVNPAAGSAVGLLGWTLFGAEIGSDILDDLGVAAPAGFPAFPGATGFLPPLGAGAYTMWIQDGDPGVANYALDFNVTTVPEPGIWAMLLAGVGLLGFQLRRRSARGRVFST